MLINQYSYRKSKTTCILPKWSLYYVRKMKGNTNIEKLRAILLLEVDLNRAYKIIFNRLILPILKAQKDIFKEIIGWHYRQFVYYIALSKKLILDIGNQIK